MTKALEGKTIIVTGAGAGIGLGILRAIINAGGQAYGLDADPAALPRIEAEGAVPLHVDVGDPEALAAAIRSAREGAGRLDGLVSNAGVTVTAPFLEAEVATWDRLWEINQRSVLVGCQAAARIMVADGRKGALVNVSSVHATASDQSYEGYAGTKGAILAMTRAMAWSLGPHGIRANVLSPGLTMTEAVAEVAATPDALARFKSWHADGTVSSTEEIGQAVLFLLSDASAALSGTEVIADHGTVARLCDLGG